MDKTEILRRAQSKKTDLPDEMELQVDLEGKRAALLIILLVCFILTMFKIFVGQPWRDLCGIYAVMMGTIKIYEWYRLRRRKNLVLGIVWWGISIAFFWLYLVEIHIIVI